MYEIILTSNLSHTLSNRDIEINYLYYNNYKKSQNVNYNATITSELRDEIVGDSNYINVSNNIITTLEPFDVNKSTINLIYTEFHQKKIFITENNLQENNAYSNIYLRTFTKNILRYNSNIDYIESRRVHSLR